ncbi:unnamed protein product [Ectocarpus sp. 12 AP-2014]
MHHENIPFQFRCNDLVLHKKSHSKQNPPRFTTSTAGTQQQTTLSNTTDRAHRPFAVDLCIGTSRIQTSALHHLAMFAVKRIAVIMAIKEPGKQNVLPHLCYRASSRTPPTSMCCARNVKPTGKFLVSHLLVVCTGNSQRADIRHTDHRLKSRPLQRHAPPSKDFWPIRFRASLDPRGQSVTHLRPEELSANQISVCVQNQTR